MTTRDAEPRGMDRGRFVKIAGVGAGLAIAGPLASAKAAAGISLKLGVIVPAGASYPLMGRSLLDGLRLGLEEARTGGMPVTATLVSREIGGGHVGASAAVRGLLDDGVDVVVGGVSALVAEQLAPLFGERATPLIVANTGAHFVQAEARNPFVLHNSLLYWQASFAVGRWAAANLGSQAFVAASLADAGYDTVYAFRRGFESAGGTIVGDAVSHADPASSGLSDVFAATRGSGVALVYGLYSGAAAAEFVQGYASSGGPARLVAGGLAVEDYLLSTIGAGAADVLSAASWTASAGTKANQAFTKSFRSRYGRAADPFAALGYDTALLVVEGARRATTGGLGLRRLVEALAGATVTGPRGTLVVDADTNTVTGPVSIRQVKRAAGGLANQVVAAAAAVGSSPAELSELAAGARSGYINEYLCA